MSLSKKIDYVEEALSRLLEQYKNKPKIEALISPWLARIQVLEDITWEVITLRYLNTAVGVQLDVLGKILGAPRSGLEDEAYRIRLKAQGIILRSSGVPPQLETLLQLCCPYAFTLTEDSIATLLIELTDVVDPLAFDVTVLWNVLIEAKAGGVRLELTWTTDENDFLFAEHDATYVVPVLDDEHGLGGYADPWTIGGSLAATLSQ